MTITPEEWYNNTYSRSVYILLIESFLEKRLSIKDFEVYFLIIFTNDNTNIPEKDYVVLNKLFQSVDAFCPFDDIRDNSDLDESELRQECLKSLNELNILDVGFE